MRPIRLEVVTDGTRDSWNIYKAGNPNPFPNQMERSDQPVEPDPDVLLAIKESAHYLKCELGVGTTFELRSTTFDTVHFAGTAVVGVFDCKLEFLDYEKPSSGFLKMVRIPQWWGKNFPAGGKWGWNLDSNILPTESIEPPADELFKRLKQPIPLAYAIEVREFCRTVSTDLRIAYRSPNLGLASVRLALDHNAPFGGYCPMPNLMRDGGNLKLTRGELLLSAAFHSGWSPRVVDDALVLIPSPIRGIANSPPTVDNLEKAAAKANLTLPVGGSKVSEFLQSLETKFNVPVDVHPQVGASWLDPVRPDLLTNRTLYQILDLVAAMTDSRWDWVESRAQVLPTQGSYGRTGRCS